MPADCGLCDSAIVLGGFNDFAPRYVPWKIPRYSVYNSTQRTTHQSEWLTRGKKLKQLIRIPDSWSDSLIFFLKISTLLQRNNAAGRLFHASTILTEKKYLHVSKWACGFILEVHDLSALYSP